MDSVLAHGVSSRQDLPLPFGFAMTGALTAMAVSFVALGVLWRTSRLDGAYAGRPLPTGLAEFVDSTEVRVFLRLVGLALAGFTAFAALAGPNVPENPTAPLVYVVFWCGLIPASLLLGPVWRRLNPLRTIHALLYRALRLPPDHRPYAMPRRLGHWPAALSLFAFVWLELCAPDRDNPRVVAIWFAGYAGVHLTAAILFGAAWFARCDGFEVFSDLVGRLSVLGRRADSTLVVRNPLHNLDAVPASPGLVAVLAVMLGSTAFDSVTTTKWWLRRAYESPLDTTSLNSIALVAAMAAVALAFGLASWLAGIVSRTGVRGTATSFTHALVPIATGYLIAHYFSLLVFGGQRALISASDPLVNGANLFGTAHRQLDYSVLSTTTIATVQVVAIVTGHILGVFAAHDRSVRLFPHREAVVGQLPMMTLMLGYTFGGLSLLFAG